MLCCMYSLSILLTFCCYWFLGFFFAVNFDFFLLICLDMLYKFPSCARDVFDFNDIFMSSLFLLFR